jgi:Methyltransferase FkbM domain
MVVLSSFSKKGKPADGIYCLLCLATTCVTVLFATVTSSNLRNYITIDDTIDASSAASLRSMLLSTFEKDDNARKIKLLRQKTREQCDASTSISDLIRIPNNQIAGFKVPNGAIPKFHDSVNVIQQCKNVVMDFGANIGDTLGHVIDSGLISCDRTGNLGADTLQSHFNVETNQFESVKKLNKLTKHLQHLMTKDKPDQGPEDYCYYGIEGNPHFTERLQQLEDYAMAINPRPVQHMHFFTESVGSGEDGMTKLYLDTVNTDHNFWGSSIYKDHQDVRQSATGKDVESFAAPVMGYTLGTLMRMTLKAFDPDAPEKDRKGSHFILKVDIEGGEYPLMHQAITDGTLCEFVKLGNTADIFIEFHSVKVTGNHDYVGKTKELKDSLTSCGVTMGNLGAFWA